MHANNLVACLDHPVQPRLANEEELTLVTSKRNDKNTLKQLQLITVSRTTLLLNDVFNTSLY